MLVAAMKTKQSSEIGAARVPAVVKLWKENILQGDDEDYIRGIPGQIGIIRCIYIYM